VISIAQSPGNPTFYSRTFYFTYQIAWILDTPRCRELSSYFLWTALQQCARHMPPCEDASLSYIPRCNKKIEVGQKTFPSDTFPIDQFLLTD